MSEWEEKQEGERLVTVIEVLQYHGPRKHVNLVIAYNAFFGEGAMMMIRM